ncbi:MAG: hypothetical protein ABI835_21005, partial [Chloroflexota bacterium]
MILLSAACASPPATLRPVFQPTNTQGVSSDSSAPTLTLRPSTDSSSVAATASAITQTPTIPAIIFESNRSGRYEIYAMNSAGGSIVQLTDSAASGAEGSGSPDWSRDGLRVA